MGYHAAPITDRPISKATPRRLHEYGLVSVRNLPGENCSPAPVNSISTWHQHRWKKGSKYINPQRSKARHRQRGHTELHSWWTQFSCWSIDREPGTAQSGLITEWIVISTENDRSPNNISPSAREYCSAVCSWYHSGLSLSCTPQWFLSGCVCLRYSSSKATVSRARFPRLRLHLSSWSHGLTHINFRIKGCIIGAIFLLFKV